MNTSPFTKFGFNVETDGLAYQLECISFIINIMRFSDNIQWLSNKSKNRKVKKRKGDGLGGFMVVRWNVGVRIPTSEQLCDAIIGTKGGLS